MDPDKIKGNIQRPYQQPPEPEDKIDPKKFKRVMKIEETDESQKRQKRNMKREEEEGDDEAVEGSAPPPSADSFAELMSDKEKLNNVFDKESVGTRRQETPKERSPYEAPPSGSIDTEGTQFEEKKPPEEQPSHEKLAPSTEELAPSSQIDQRKKKKEKDTSLLESQPKPHELKPKKKTAPPPKEKLIPGEIKQPFHETKGAPTPPPIKKPDEHLPTRPEGKKEKIPHALPKKEELFHRLTPNEIRSQLLGEEKITPSMEGMPIPPPSEGEQGEFGQRKKEEVPFIEATAGTASIPLPTFEPTMPPITPSETTPSYAKLSPEVYELFEKMGGVMMIQQNQGITTTTMTINLPNSVFNGTEIILNQYSTAPHSYNIQLIGSSEAVKVFTANLSKLENAFKAAHYNFEVNLLTPSIAQGKKSPHLIRRKKSAGDKGGKQGKG